MHKYVRQRPYPSMLITKILAIITTLLVSSHSIAEQTAADYGTLINLSGKQRMLSQKMSKEVMLIALDIDKEANVKNNLKSTSALFDKTLKGLRFGDADLGLPATSAKRIIRQLDKVDEIWATFYPTIQQITASGTVTAEQVTVIAQQTSLLKRMNKAVGAYEKAAAKGDYQKIQVGCNTQIFGKQRMLTSKMSKEFLLIAYGFDVESNKLSLLETYTLFERTLKGLVEGDETFGVTRYD